MIGEIKLFAGSYAPRGWKQCNGESVNCWQYLALYGILGKKYGGDGDMFELPRISPVPDSDGRGESMYIICVEGDYPAIP